jgi:hypothetical protein
MVEPHDALNGPEIRRFGQVEGMLTSGRGQLSGSRNSGVKSSQSQAEFLLKFPEPNPPRRGNLTGTLSLTF